LRSSRRCSFCEAVRHSRWVAASLYLAIILLLLGPVERLWIWIPLIVLASLATLANFRVSGTWQTSEASAFIAWLPAYSRRMCCK
jgi:hypothetical protein